MTCAVLSLDIEDAGIVMRAVGPSRQLLIIDRQFREFPNAEVIDRLVDPEACASIDKLAIERMSGLTQALLGAVPQANDEEFHALAALLGGFTSACRWFAQALKVRAALKLLGVTELEVLAPSNTQATLVRALTASGEFRIRSIAAPRGDRRNTRERIRRFIVSEPAIAAVASIILHRMKGGKQPTLARAALLMEASSRHLPYLDAFLAQKDSARVVFFSERRKDHIEKITAKRPNFPVVLTDHAVVNPGLLLQWSSLHARWSAKRLAQFAGETWGSAGDNAIGRMLCALLVPGMCWRLFQSLAIARLFDRILPRSLLLQSDNSAAFERIAIAHARRRSIPTACLQHGTFTEPVNMDGAACDTYFVWGQGAKEFLTRYRPHCPRIEIVGQPDFARAANSASTLPPLQENRWRVLYATRANSTETASYYHEREAEFFDTIESAWPKDGRLELVVKPHPRANPKSWYERRAQLFTERTGACATVTNRPLADEIMASHLVLTTGGTTVLEAVALARTAIYLVPPGRGDTVGWTKFSCLHTLWPHQMPDLAYRLARRPLVLLDFESPKVASECARLLNFYVNLDAVLSAQAFAAKVLALPSRTLRDDPPN